MLACANDASYEDVFVEQLKNYDEIKPLEIIILKW